MINYAYYSSPFGVLQIGWEDSAIVSLRTQEDFGCDHTPCPLSDLAASQLQRYFSGISREFELPLAPKGTAFQRCVWNALLQIPYGETRTYRQIAEQIGKPKACRAVGAACGKNPIWILIPCHRVVGASNGLTGYAGGIQMKRELLALERKSRDNVTEIPEILG